MTPAALAKHMMALHRMFKAYGKQPASGYNQYDQWIADGRNHLKNLRRKARGDPFRKTKARARDRISTAIYSTVSFYPEVGKEKGFFNGTLHVGFMWHRRIKPFQDRLSKASHLLIEIEEIRVNDRSIVVYEALAYDVAKKKQVTVYVSGPAIAEEKLEVRETLNAAINRAIERTNRRILAEFTQEKPND